MKVLITVPRLDMPGGVANYYRTLRGYLDADKEYFEIGRVPGETSRWQELRRLVSDYRRFHRRLADGNFDLVHLNPSLVWRSVIRDGLLLLIAKRHDHKVLVFFRGWEPECETRIRRRFLWLFRLVYGKADAFVVLGEVFRQALVTMQITAPIHRATTVAGKAALAGSAPGDRNLQPAAESPARPDAFSLLFLSRLDKGKGLAEAIEAFSLLRTQMAGAELVVAGDGPERSSAEKLVQDRQITGVRFIGHVDGAAKDRAYRSASAFFFPTFFGEGMPNSILEAMACGLPVVTRPVGGIPDFFEDGRMGYALDSRSPADFAAALLRLAQDRGLCARIGSYNREYAARHFSAPRVAERLVDIYREVAGGDTSG